MQRSLFCPALPAETSSGLVRLFDILRSGCIPVVVSFRTRWGSKVSWWRHDGPPVEWSLPFTWELNWRELVVEVPERRLSHGDFVETCLGLSQAEIKAKQQKILKVRSSISYDLEGGKRDAFSLLMDGVRSALWKLGPRLGLQGAQLAPMRNFEICDATPRGGRLRPMLPSRSGTIQKAWTHSYGEVSCLRAHRWQPPNGFLDTGPAGPAGRAVVVERYRTQKVKPSGRRASLRIHALEISSEDVTGADARMAACRHEGLPVACHDLLIDDGDHVKVGYCYVDSQTDLPASKSVCTLLPTVTSGQLPQVGRWQVITWLCKGFDGLESLAQQLQLAGLAGHQANRTFDLGVYALCGAAGARAVLHHVHSVLLAIGERAAAAPDGIVLIHGDLLTSAPSPNKLLDFAAQHALPQARSHQRLTLLAGHITEHGIGNFCTGFSKLFSSHCPLHSIGLRGSPQAVAFTTASLTGASTAEWAIASAIQLEGAQDNFDLVSALLVKALRNSNASQNISLDKSLVAEDPFATCFATFEEGFVEKSGMPPYYWGEHRQEAGECFSLGGAYAVVTTGIHTWLGTRESASPEEASLKTMLKNMRPDETRHLEAFGVCVPAPCRRHIKSIAWHYVTDYQMFRQSRFPAPPVPGGARIRLFLSNLSVAARWLKE